MRNFRSLQIAVPAFLLGCVVTAGLTTTAQAQAKAAGAKEPPMYHVVSDESTMNKYAAEGYRVKLASGTANWTNYLMERTR